VHARVVAATLAIVSVVTLASRQIVPRFSVVNGTGMTIHVRWTRERWPGSVHTLAPGEAWTTRSPGTQLRIDINRYRWVFTLHPTRFNDEPYANFRSGGSAFTTA
jgi:hypothetical protein